MSLFNLNKCPRPPAHTHTYTHHCRTHIQNTNTACDRRHVCRTWLKIVVTNRSLWTTLQFFCLSFFSLFSAVAPILPSHFRKWLRKILIIMPTRPQYCYTVAIYHFKVNRGKDSCWLSKNDMVDRKKCTAIITVIVLERRQQSEISCVRLQNRPVSKLRSCGQQLHF